MVPTLRPYQEHDLHQVRTLFREHRSVLLVQPTGAGKGTLATYIVTSASGRAKRILFLVNRRALVHDMSKRITKLGLDHGVIMGDDPRRKPWLPVHVASIDTLHRRQHLPQADLLIIDEAHFAVSPTWMKVVEKYPEAKILGMTATPIRLDGRGLGEMFSAMVPGPSVQSLIDQQYLVPAVVFRPKGPDVSGVGKVAGDFNQKQLAEVCDKPKLVGDVVEHWQKHASDRKTAAFGVSQHHASEIAEKFRCAGVNFAYVDADTPDVERDRIWNDFDYGTLRGVSSVGVISYGWDHPICSCIIGARATASVGLWRQILGRGSRPHPGKENFLVLDHFDNTGRLDTFFEDDVQWSLDGKALKDSGEKTVSIATCRKCFATFRAGPLKCPYCLAEIPKQAREIEVVKGELEQVQRVRKALAIEEWRQKVTGDQRREKFEEFRRIARERGYSTKWPAVKFSIIFGTWPPREWSRGA
jgi:superfamily II DNA or RNA helicase